MTAVFRLELVGSCYEGMDNQGYSYRNIVRDMLLTVRVVGEYRLRLSSPRRSFRLKGGNTGVKIGNVVSSAVNVTIQDGGMEHCYDGTITTIDGYSANDLHDLLVARFPNRNFVVGKVKVKANGSAQSPKATCNNDVAKLIGTASLTVAELQGRYNMAFLRHRMTKEGQSSPVKVTFDKFEDKIEQARKALKAAADIEGKIDPRKCGSHTASISVYLFQKIGEANPKFWERVIRVLIVRDFIREIDGSYFVVEILEDALSIEPDPVVLTYEQEVENRIAEHHIQLEELRRFQPLEIKRIKAITVKIRIAVAQLEEYKEINARLAQLQCELEQMP